MATTYDVRIWSVEEQRNARGSSYRVQWIVSKRRFNQGFGTRSLADSFRSDLVRAARQGEAFDEEQGLPVSLLRTINAMSWYDFACSYADMKWTTAAASYRKSIAEALTTITPAMLSSQRGAPDARLMRTALREWAFNTKRRHDPDCPEDIVQSLRWVERNSLAVSALVRPEIIRQVVMAVSSKLDGSAAAPTVVHRKRAVLSNAIAFAIERKLLAVDPLPALKSVSSGSTHTVADKVVDKRSVVNPIQARTLLAAVGECQRSGPRLVAFFALLYFAALRPEEAADLRKHNLSLPENGFGELHLERTAPEVGRTWTDSGHQRDRRQLKHRPKGHIRTVPCPPELTRILHDHLSTYGTDPQGRLFFGLHGGELAAVTYRRVWARSRQATLTAPVCASPLAARPYDLRHAAVSTWLNAGVDAAQVAEWAGHSLDVLLSVYAKCIDGREAQARQRITDALGWRDPEGSGATGRMRGDRP